MASDSKRQSREACRKGTLPTSPPRWVLSAASDRLRPVLPAPARAGRVCCLDREGASRRKAPGRPLLSGLWVGTRPTKQTLLPLVSVASGGPGQGHRRTWTSQGLGPLCAPAADSPATLLRTSFQARGPGPVDPAG